MALPRLFRRWSKFLRARLFRRRRPIRFFRLRFDPLEVRVVPNTYTVTTTADAGAGSLRQAILDANANAGADTIDFTIGTGVQTIAPLSALPAVTDPVTIDGTTQPGFGGTPLIELRGDGAGAGVSGLNLAAGSGGTTVRGLVINRFTGNGIIVGSSNNVLAGNYIGTDAGGSVDLGNNVDGIVFTNSSTGTLIGGVTAGDRNLISGNEGAGIRVAGGSSATIQGNFIGTNAAGGVDLGNTGYGINIDNTAGSLIGGTVAGARNVISGNNASGILLRFGGAQFNSIQGNFIGTTAAGTAALANSERGILLVDGASSNTVGGSAAGAGNLISGNTGDGIDILGATTTANLVAGNLIGTDVTGNLDLGNASYGVGVGGPANTVGGAAAGARNVVSGNNAGGVGIFFSTSNNVILGNYIGTNSAGTAALGNATHGVHLTPGTTNNTIGDTAAGAGNLISGNAQTGILVESAFDNAIRGNFIGTNVAGTAAIANGANGGIRLTNSSGNAIGGSTAGAGNVISGNSGDGVNITGASTPLGTVSWWKADGNASDAVGTNNGTLQGGATFAAGLAGGQAFNLDGVNDYVTQSLPANVQTPNITLDAWVFLNAIGSGGTYGQTIVFAEPGGSNSSGRGAGLTISDDGKVKFVKGSGDGLFEVAVGATTLSTGVWHHVAGTFDGSVMRVYLDGAEDGSLANSQPILWAGSGGFPNPGQLYFGAFKTDQLGSGSTVPDVGFLNGRIDEVAVYNRGLTAADVQRIYAAGGPAKGGNTVQGNVIGLNPAGTTAITNGGFGVFVNASAGHLIGGPTAGARNIISGNFDSGVHLAGAAAAGNLVLGNYIGTDLAGNADLGNGAEGVEVSSGAHNNFIGGAAAGAGNVISGNNDRGVLIRAGSPSNLVQGNIVGLNASGTADLGNTLAGVEVNQSANNTIGGPTAGARNVISGNNTNGVLIIGSTATGNLVSGNYIGTNAAGSTAVANSGAGVSLSGGATNNTVGGTTAADRNVISGNLGDGVNITGASTPLGTVSWWKADGNANDSVDGHPGTLQGGTTFTAGLAGTQAFSFDGVDDSVDLGNWFNLQTFSIDMWVNAAPGASQVPFADIIDNNHTDFRSWAIQYDNTGNQYHFGAAGGGDVDTQFTLTPGVWQHLAITVDASHQIRAYLDGALVDTAQLAGPIAYDGSQFLRLARWGGGGRNWEGRLDEVGVFSRALTSAEIQRIYAAGGPAKGGNTVQGNIIGLNPTGTAAVGNITEGVTISSSAGHLIGGTAPGAGNVISGNRSGIQISGAAALGNLIQGNTIGLSASGTADLGNTQNGILVTTAHFNTIGGTVAGAGNVVSGNNSNGILIQSNSQGNLVQGNTIGLNAAGTAAVGNTSDGIEVSTGFNNTIGGTAAGARNVISGNSGSGVLLNGNTNVVIGNYIGTNRAGTAAIGNAVDGVNVLSVMGNRIGTNADGVDDAAERNVIAGNARFGVYLDHGSGHTVAGNYIGLAADGSTMFGHQEGIRALVSPNNVIGGASAAARNVIAGSTAIGVHLLGSSNNTVQGNYIGTNAAGTAARGNQDGVLAQEALEGSPVPTIRPADNNQIVGNVVSGNTRDGITLGATARNNVLAGNLVGLDATGAALGNAATGIFLRSGASQNRIGTDADGVNDAAEGNVISGNAFSGIAFNVAGNNTVAGNRIGTNPAGTAAIGNGQHGVFIGGSSGSNRIGTNGDGTNDAVEGNIISGNVLTGVTITGTASNNVVAGNRIGTDATGSVDLGNGNTGVFISAPNNTVGGAIPAQQNVISGNNINGVQLSGTAATGNVVAGNYIGLTAGGTAALGNTNDGVVLDAGAAGNTIGGTAAGAGNVIGGNLAGISILGAGTAGNVVQGNRIGTGVDGTAAVANAGPGIQVLNGATGNTIGGPAAGAGNVVSGNTGDGVRLTGTTVPGNTVSWWRAENNANDSADGNTATLQGGATFGDGVTGGRAFDLNGTGAYVNVGDPASGNLDFGPGSFTLDFWVNPRAYGAALLNKGSHGGLPAGFRSGFFAFLEADGTLRFELSSVDANGKAAQFLTTATIPLNAWTHVAIVRTAANLTVYFNGAAQAGTVIGGGFVPFNQVTNVSTNSPLRFGARDNNPIGNLVGFFNGRLDEVAAYNRAMTAGEVQAVYALGGISKGGTVVQGNRIGTNADGTAALGNGSDGVEVSASAGHLIGGTAAEARNVISGNDETGVMITGAGATGNVVEGNYIGLAADGTAAVGNLGIGVLVTGGATNNVVGGSASGAGNVIGGNGQVSTSTGGVYLIGAGTSGNVVAGNYIGTDKTGTADLGNAWTGVVVMAGATGNTVGGTTAGARNVISANGAVGVEVQGAGTSGNVVAGNYIGTDQTGTAPLGNKQFAGVLVWNGASNNTVGGTVAGAGNLISGNAGSGVGISDAGTSGNLVQGNRIGTDKDGMVALANSGSGVQVSGGAANNTIGGTTAGAGNVISGNANVGVFLGAGADGNTVAGNFVGTDATGATALGNTYGGVVIEGASNNVIGGTTAAARNVISGTRQLGVNYSLAAGVAIWDAGFRTTANNVVQGNYIGTDATGTVALGNAWAGVSVVASGTAGSVGNVIGGSAPGAGNLISGNSTDPAAWGGGVYLEAHHVTVAGNLIGTDKTGTAALANQHVGIQFYQGAHDNLIGGSSSYAGGVLTGAGNVISGNRGAGINITTGGAAPTDNAIQGNFIGTDITGTVALGNDTGPGTGTGIALGSPRTTVGGETADRRNVISGNSVGVVLSGPTTEGNTVLGNYIGTTVAGDAALGNATGVLIQGQAHDNTVGGTAAGAGNVISGNAGHGIQITGSGTNANAVQGNLVGTTAAGAAAVANLGDGIRIDGGATNTTIGGTAAGARNVVSGNNPSANFSFGGIHVTGPATSGTLIQGNYVGTDVTGTTAVGNLGLAGVWINGPNTTLGGTTAAARNVVSGNGTLGVYVSGVTGTQVQGNYIGLTAAGTALVPNTPFNGNGSDGVRVEGGATGTLIGGTAPGAGNVIAGNGFGVQLRQANTSNNVVQGNLIGTDHTGLVALGSGTDGINVNAPATNNQIIGNVIAASGQRGTANRSGIHVFATGTLIQGNYIGTNVEGVGDFGNLLDGIRVEGAGSETIVGNVISNSRGVGINLLNGSSANVIQGNKIGTDVSGTAALGNAGAGVVVTGPNNTIGGTAVGTGNVISGNAGDGIEITGVGASGNAIAGNLIGTDAGGALNVGNVGAGVRVSGGAHDNTIGGTAAGAGNTVAFNNLGVSCTDDTTTRITIRGNSIYANAGLAIDLGPVGPTLNDPNDADTGPNGLANFPALGAGTVGPATRAAGTLSAAPSTTYTLDFYGSDKPNPAGYGDGQHYLGSITVTTDAAGLAGFFATGLGGTGADEVVTMTATDPDGNTSEFSLVRRSNVTPYFEATDLKVTPDADLGLTVDETAADGVTTVHGTFTDADFANSYAAVIDWGDGEVTTVTVGPGAIQAGGLREFSADHAYPEGLDGDFSPTVRLTLTDTAEGHTVRLTGVFTDPDVADAHTVTIDWGDGTTDTVTNTPRDPVTDLLSFVATHRYTDDPAGPADRYPITVTVADDGGGSTTAGTELTVHNVAPRATLSNSGPAPEGGSATVSFAEPVDPSDPDRAGLRYSFDFNNDGTFEIVDGPFPFAEVPATLLVDGPAVRTIRGRVSDDDGGFTDYTIELTVTNVAPAVTELTTDSASYQENDLVTLTGTVADPGAPDDHTVVIDWNDGSPSTTLHLPAGETTFQATHRYLDDPAGAGDLYHVLVTVTDKDGDSGSATRDVLVVNAPPTAIIRGLPTSDPLEIALTSAGVDSGTQDLLNFTWSVTRLLPGGGSEAVPITPSNGGRDIRFQRAPDGTYVVTLSVADGDGGVGTDSALVIAGTTGPDTILVEPVTGAAQVEVVINGASLGQFSPGNRIIVFGNAGNDTIAVNPALTVPAELNGEAGDDSLTGGGGNDLVRGGDGDDSLLGGEGDDTVDGGAGNDTAGGGNGNDTYPVVPGSDNWLTEAGSNGIDTVDYSGANSGITFSLAVEGSMQTVDAAGNGVEIDGTFENLTGGAYDDALTGNSLDNIIFGGDGLAPGASGDSLDGGAGNDSVTGGLGNDSVVGGTGSDTVRGGAGNDVIFGGDGLTADLGSDSLVGGAGNDTVTGGSGNDSIFGGDPLDPAAVGNDSLSGGAGNDSIRGGTGNDTLLGGAGNDAIFGGDSLDMAAPIGSDSIAGGEGNDTIIGGSGNDAIFGGDGLTADTGNDSLDGGAGNDSITGGAGSDTIRGGSGNDSIFGGDGLTADIGGDSLSGGDGNDTIVGGTGNDAIFGGDPLDPIATSNDSLLGGAGNDTIVGGTGNDTIRGGSGNDAIFGGDPLDPTTVGSDTLLGGDGNDTIVGGTGNDAIFGGDPLGSSLGSDSLDGGAGNDSITGGAGSDTIQGGAGNDSIFGGDPLDPAAVDSLVGGAGNDTIQGGSGNDTIFGGDPLDPTAVGSDSLSGGAGNDSITGGSGSDTILGGAGNDVIFGGDGLAPMTIGDSLSGGEGNDTVIGGAGNDAMFGGDPLTGSLGNDSLDGAAGDDSITGGAGSDTIQGGSGNDAIFGGDGLAPTAAGDSLLGGTGNDSITGASGNDTILGGAGNDAIFAGDPLDPTAGPGNSLIGGAGNDTVVGGSGNDAIFGGDPLDPAATGNDSLLGGAGNDSITGGLGNDTILGGTGSDTIRGGSGNDAIFGGDAVAADAAIDSLIGGAGNDTAIGGAGNDIIYGGDPLDPAAAGDDSLVGGAGNDSLDGGAGNDTINGGAGSDTVTGGSGNDVIFGGDLPSPGPDPLPIPGEPPGSDSLDGGAGNDSVTGGAGTDTVQGGAGNDTLTGGAGNDVIFGGEDTDTLSEAVGVSVTLTDTELRAADVDQLAGIEAARLTGGPGSDVLDARGFSGPAELTGGDGDDTVLGGAGNDVLAGGAGNDSLVGGAGNDEYVFAGDTVGADEAVEAANGGTDTINLYALAGPVNFSLSVPGPQALPGGSLTLVDPFAFENLTGTPFADYLVGNPGPNVLIGSGGQDTLEGGEGDDVIQAGVTQVVYLDFDSYTGPGKRPYGPAERDQVQARLEAAYSPFGFRFTQARPADGAFATVFFNKTPFRINGREQPGGLADELDWRNLGLGRTVAVDVNGFLGYATRQVSPTTSSFVALSATVAAHELGHLVGLRHADAFGPVGSGVYLPENAAGFLPVYPGPTAAGETPLHLMASPASTRTDLLAATGTPFFGEREALKLAFADTGTTVAEQARPNRSGIDAQPIELAPLSVPNTLLSGLRAGATFDAAAVDVVGSIEIDPTTGRSEDDYYAFQGHAGDVISVELLSVTLDRVADPIDSIARVWLQNPDGTLSPVPYYATPAAENDDNFETRDAQLIDLVLPTDGTYLIQVDTFTFLGMPDPPPGGSPSAYTDTDTGAYELFVYRIAPAAEGAPGSRSGDLGVGGGGKDTMIASSGSDLYFEEGTTEPPAPVIAPPAITPPAAQSALEATPLWVKLGSFADSSASGPWAVTVNWGDQSPAAAFTTDTAGSLGEWPHTFAANGKYAVTVKVTSAAGLSASRMFLVDVANVAPAVTVHDQEALDLIPKAFDLGAFADPALDNPWRVVVNWGDGSAPAAFSRTADGALGTLTHTFDRVGTFAVTLTVTDKDGGVGTGRFDVVVRDHTPQAQADTYTTDEDTALHVPAPGVLANDTTPTGNTLTAALVAGPAHGTLMLLPDGSFDYTPAADFNGTDTFTYRAIDGPFTTTDATVTLVVAPVQDAPVARDDAAEVDEDAGGAVNVLANDTDVDGDVLTVSAVTQPAHGAVVVNPNNTVTYTPAANYNGPDSFTYTVSDGHGGIATATVRVTVRPVNDPPAAADDSAVTDERVPVTIDVLNNDTDLDGDALSVGSVTQPAHGTVSINPDRTVTYTPAFNFFGEDAFTYRATDGSALSEPATVRITVRQVNRPPEVQITGLPDTSPEGTDLTAGSAVTDPDPGSGLTYAWTVRKNGGPFASGTGANLLFTPDDNGTYAVTLTVTDGFGAAGSDTETVVVTNVAPTGTVTRSALVGLTGVDVTVGWANVTDPSPVDRAAGFRYSFARTPEALAGTYAAAGLDPSGTIHFDLTPGTYTVYLRVFDKDDEFSDATVAVLIGTPGNDVLTGTDGIDLMFGLGGNDSLAGLGGDDWLDGGDKDDTLDGGSGNDVVLGMEGDDRLSAAEGDDTLSGGHGADVLTAGAGHSLLDGGDGDDQLFAGPGDATLLGGRAADTLWSGPGNDSLVGGDGADQVFGTTGEDTIDGGTGADTVSGGAGDEVIYGGDGDDSLTGGDGNDRLDGGPGADSLDGGAGNDVLTAGDGINVLAGGDGADTLLSASGADRLTGGAGPDVFRVTAKNVDGEDLVQDFEKGSDRIDLTGLPGVGWSNVTWARSGSDTLVTVTLPAGLGGGTLQIRLKKYLGPLDLTDFLVNP